MNYKEEIIEGNSLRLSKAPMGKVTFEKIPEIRPADSRRMIDHGWEEMGGDEGKLLPFYISLYSVNFLVLSMFVYFLISEWWNN